MTEKNAAEIATLQRIVELLDTVEQLSENVEIKLPRNKDFTSVIWRLSQAASKELQQHSQF